MKNLTLLFLTLLIFSCTDKTAEETAKLKEETFKIHDEVMPLSMNLEDVKAEVMKRTLVDTTLKKTALDISLVLDKAYNDMEAWMPKLGSATDMKDGEEKLKAFIELKTEGEKIKQSTIDAKKKAEEFLK